MGIAKWTFKLPRFTVSNGPPPKLPNGCSPVAGAMPAACPRQMPERMASASVRAIGYGLSRVIIESPLPLLHGKIVVRNAGVDSSRRELDVENEAVIEVSLGVKGNLRSIHATIVGEHHLYRDV